MAGRSKSKTTTDCDEIRQWLEARDGRPAVVKSTRGKGDDTGVLRIDFPARGAGEILTAVLRTPAAVVGGYDKPIGLLQ